MGWTAVLLRNLCMASIGFGLIFATPLVVYAQDEATEPTTTAPTIPPLIDADTKPEFVRDPMAPPQLAAPPAAPAAPTKNSPPPGVPLVLPKKKKPSTLIDMQTGLPVDMKKTIATKKKKKKAKVAPVLEKEVFENTPDDAFEENVREPAWEDSESDLRQFQDTISNIVDFNEQWEVNFTRQNRRYKVPGQPEELYEYQRTGQYLDVEVHEIERRVISIKPIRVRFKPVR